jgi:hypothetical protein
MDVALAQRQKRGLGVRIDLEDQAVQLRRPAPVVLVGLQDDLVVVAPLLEHEGPGADGIVAEVLAGLDRRLRADHAVPDHGKAGEEGRESMLELERDGVVVDRLVGIDGAIGEVDVAFDRTGVVDRVRVAFLQAVEALHEALGIEGRAVMEGDALAQVEGVGHAVVRNLPALRETGPDLDRAELVVHQAVIDRRHHEAGAVVQHRLGIEAGRVRLLGDHQRSGIGSSHDCRARGNENAGCGGALHQAAAGNPGWLTCQAGHRFPPIWRWRIFSAGRAAADQSTTLRRRQLRATNVLIAAIRPPPRRRGRSRRWPG